MTVYKIIAIFGFVLANAFFVAAEFGLVAVRRTRIEELAAGGNRRAVSARKAIGELNLILSACQLGITFSSLGLGWIGEPAIAGMLEGVFDFVPPPFSVVATHGVAVAIAFIIITGLHVVLGELVPKNLAIAVPEGTALWVASAIRGFSWMFHWVIWLFNEGANLILRLMGVTPRPELAGVHTPDELAIIVEESRRGGTIRGRQSEILTKTLEFPEKRAVDAMVPRTAAQAVSIDSSMKEVLTLAEKTGFSRFPVWKERPDEFTGVVYLKDALKEGRETRGAKVKDVIRQAPVVPESLPLERVLVEMQRTRHHFFIVVDEFGSTAGIITLEDILEELVGEIRDEYDVRDHELKQVQGGVRVPGSMRPDELEDATGCALPDGEYETVAGFILEKLGRMARRGDEVTIEGWKMRVANVRRRRIVSVDVQPNN